MVNIGDLSIQLVLKTEQFEKQFKSIDQTLRRAATRFREVGSILSVGLTAPLALAGKSIISFATNFEKELVKIETLVGLSREQVQGWRDDILALGPAIGRGPTELAKAMFVITSAGARGSRALETLEVSAKAAAIGLGETKDIARAITSIINTYGEANINAAKAGDQLVAIVRFGNLEAEGLAGSLGRIIGIAKETGVSFSDLGASIATFTRLGVSVEEAITGTRGVISSLIKPSNDAQELLGQVQSSMEAVRDSIVKSGFVDTMVALSKAFRENNLEIAKLFPNVRALGQFLGTFTTQGKDARDIQLAIANSAGLMEEAFARTTGTAALKFAQLQSALEVLGIALGDAVLPQVSRLTVAFTQFIVKLSTTEKRVLGFAVALGAAIAVIGPFLFFIGVFLQVVTGFVAGLITLVKWMTLLSSAFIIAAVAAEILVVGLSFLFAAIITDTTRSRRAIADWVGDLPFIGTAMEAMLIKMERAWLRFLRFLNEKTADWALSIIEIFESLRVIPTFGRIADVAQKAFQSISDNARLLANIALIQIESITERLAAMGAETKEEEEAIKKLAEALQKLGELPSIVGAGGATPEFQKFADGLKAIFDSIGDDIFAVNVLTDEFDLRIRQVTRDIRDMGEEFKISSVEIEKQVQKAVAAIRLLESETDRASRAIQFNIGERIAKPFSEIFTGFLRGDRELKVMEVFTDAVIGLFGDMFTEMIKKKLDFDVIFENNFLDDLVGVLVEFGKKAAGLLFPKEIVEPSLAGITDFGGLLSGAGFPDAQVAAQGVTDDACAITQEVTDCILDEVKDFGGGFVDSFKGIFTKLGGLLKGFGSGFMDVLSGLGSALSQLLGSFSGGVGGGGTGVAGGILSIVSLFLGAGGIVTGPQLAVIGESGPEAVIPLSQLDQMVSGGNGETTVIINSPFPARVDERQDSNGQREIIVTIEKVVTDSIARGGPVAQSLETFYGNRRQPGS